MTDRQNLPRDVVARARKMRWFTEAQLKIIDAKIYHYYVPDWSEWSWRQIKECMGDTLALATEA